MFQHPWPDKAVLGSIRLRSSYSHMSVVSLTTPALTILLLRNLLDGQVLLVMTCGGF